MQALWKKHAAPSKLLLVALPDLVLERLDRPGYESKCTPWPLTPDDDAGQEANIQGRIRGSKKNGSQIAPLTAPSLSPPCASLLTLVSGHFSMSIRIGFCEG